MVCWISSEVNGNGNRSQGVQYSIQALYNELLLKVCLLNAICIIFNPMLHWILFFYFLLLQLINICVYIRYAEDCNEFACDIVEIVQQDDLEKRLTINHIYIFIQFILILRVASGV